MEEANALCSYILRVDTTGHKLKLSLMDIQSGQLSEFDTWNELVHQTKVDLQTRYVLNVRTLDNETDKS